MEEIVIVAAARTAVGKFRGSLTNIPATELGAIVVAEVLQRSGVAADQIGEVIMGQVLAAGAGQNPARQALIKSGLNQATPAMTINAVCGSGLKAVMLAAQAVACGDSEIVIAGGQENMSASPHVLLGSRDGQRMGDWKMIDSMIVDGLWDVYNQYHMGITAENVAKKYSITREAQDALALASQQKAAAAQEAGRFKDEIVSVSIPQRKGDPIVFDADEYLNKKTNAQALAGTKALARAGWKAQDLDLLEINEAFAAQACAVNQEMGWDTSKVNVNGGAIALGHPIGASGCRILVSLLYEMQRRDARKGIASLCIGGGMGVALTIER